MFFFLLRSSSARVCAALGGETLHRNPVPRRGRKEETLRLPRQPTAAAAALLSVVVVKSEILALAKRSLVGCSSLAEAEVGPGLGLGLGLGLG